MPDLSDSQSIAPLTRASATRFGHKAWRLGKLKRSGLPVPDGLCISSDYMSRLASDSDKGSAPRLLVEKRVHHWLLDRAGGIVVVRSSALSEDSLHASFAGIFESRIVDVDEVAIWRAAQSVFASAGTPHVQEYLKTLKAPRLNTAMSVIIQDYIKGLIGGVLFTCHPLDEQLGVVEFALNGAEGVTSGSGNITNYEFRRTHLPEDLERIQLPSHLQDKYQGTSLGKALAIITSGAISVLGEPLDIEWTWDGHSVWILQARPLTATIRRHLQ
jgi:pyruvate,water dikinase